MNSCMKFVVRIKLPCLSVGMSTETFLLLPFCLSRVCVFVVFCHSFLLPLSWTQWIFRWYCLTHCPPFTIFLIIFNFRLLLFSCCSDTVSLRGSIKFHLIWTWWNCVRLSKELSLLYLVQILNWVWSCDPAALILRLMDFYFPLSQMWLPLCFEGKYFFLLHCTAVIFIRFLFHMLHAEFV